MYIWEKYRTFEITSGIILKMNLPLYKGFTLEITNKWWPLTTLNRWLLYRIKIYSKMHRESTTGLTVILKNRCCCTFLESYFGKTKCIAINLWWLHINFSWSDFDSNWIYIYMCISFVWYELTVPFKKMLNIKCSIKH